MKAIENYFCDQIADKVANKQNALEWFVAILKWALSIVYPIVEWALNNLKTVAIMLLVAVGIVIAWNWLVSREPPF